MHLCSQLCRAQSDACLLSRVLDRLAKPALKTWNHTPTKHTCCLLRTTETRSLTSRNIQYIRLQRQKDTQLPNTHTRANRNDKESHKRNHTQARKILVENNTNTHTRTPHSRIPLRTQANHTHRYENNCAHTHEFNRAQKHDNNCKSGCEIPRCIHESFTQSWIYYQSAHKHWDDET